MTTTSPLRRRLGTERPDDEGAALLVVVLLMLLVGALAVLVLGAVISQVRPTTAAQESTRTVFAAEAGVQTALSQIRSARTGTGSTALGDRRALPCSLTGSVAGTGGAATFTATVSYYKLDPSAQADTWLTENAMRCTPGGGTPSTPSYALVRSTGNDATGSVLVRGRQLQAVYTLNIVNKNVPGGQLLTAQGAACLQADAATAGSTVHYVAASSCSSSKPLQQWVYDTGYHLVLASTITTTTSGTTSTASGMCLTQPDLAASVRTVTLSSCTLDSRSPMQLWSYEGGARFRGQNADNTDYGGNCLWSGVTGSPVDRLLVSGGSGTCDSNAQDYGSFTPEAKVGAGAASMATNQVVNYLQFGRCMDVTYEDVDQARMIVYPCKQDPSGGTRLSWNHRWYYGAETGVRSEPTGTAPMSTRLRVLRGNDSSKASCLTTPASTDSPAYVVFRTCDGSTSQQYARTYTTGDPSTSYLFRTSDGRCLSLGPAFEAGVSVSTIVAATCTGGSEQKWNAPSTAQDATVSSQQELTVAAP